MTTSADGVKNHNLGLEVPYRYGSEMRRCLPDFIVLVNDGHDDDDLLHLIVEIKGYRREDTKEKNATMDTDWVPGVNNAGTLGRWAFAELTEMYQIKYDFKAKAAGTFVEMIARRRDREGFRLTALRTAHGHVPAALRGWRRSGPQRLGDPRTHAIHLKIIRAASVAHLEGSEMAAKTGYRVAPARGPHMGIESPMIPAVLTSAAELRRLGDEIAELSAHLDAASARLLDLIREFDAREGWSNGFRSCAAWLSWRVGLDMGAAREKVRVALALGVLPGLARALASGELSYSKVRALTRVATPETEERLLAMGRAGTAEQVERIVRGWRRVDRIAENQETARQQKSRALHVYPDEDGMVVIRGRLTPEMGALLLRALEAGRESVRKQIRVEDSPSTGQQQADALALIAETALHHGLDPGAPGERYQVVVHVDAAALADPDQPGQSVIDGGTHVPAETSRRLGCDASRVVMRHDDEGRVTEVGARTRTIPPALRRALHHRDRGCRFPGCGLPFGQGHHVRHWANGGPTTLSNLAMLCRLHHRAVHEEGFQVDRHPDGSLQFRWPDGRPLPDVPSPSIVPADPAHGLRAGNVAQGLHIHARTACTGWPGEHLDVGYAIDVLHPLALGG